MRYGRRNRYPGNGPYRNIPQHQRPRRLYRGIGYGYRETDPTKCARYPWLDRWWWANSEEESPKPETEKEFVETQIGYLDNEIAHLKERLREITDEENQ